MTQMEWNNKSENEMETQLFVFWPWQLYYSTKKRKELVLQATLTDIHGTQNACSTIKENC